jgi:hypothetical protein
LPPLAGPAEEDQATFNEPNTNASATGLGRITGAGAGREIQVAFKLIR